MCSLQRTVASHGMSLMTEAPISPFAPFFRLSLDTIATQDTPEKTHTTQVFGGLVWHFPWQSESLLMQTRSRLWRPCPSDSVQDVGGAIFSQVKLRECHPQGAHLSQRSTSSGPIAWFLPRCAFARTSRRLSGGFLLVRHSGRQD